MNEELDFFVSVDNESGRALFEHLVEEMRKQGQPCLIPFGSRFILEVEKVTPREIVGEGFMLCVKGTLHDALQG